MTAIPSYDARSFIRVLEGGSTFPLLVDVDEGQSFVVKAFTKEHIQQTSATFCEFLGNILAKEFGIETLECALMNLTTSFIDSLPKQVQERISKSGDGLKFCCRYLEGAGTYTHSLGKFISKSNHIANIFAYDILIRNVDRTKAKPNILLQNNSIYLIDHELSFDVDEKYLYKFNNLDTSVYPFESHIFYESLKKTRKDKLNLFDEFEENLKRLNLQVIEELISFLKNKNIWTAKNYLISYFSEVKKQSYKFVQMLQMMIK
jgi:hypothetical protein